MNPGSGLKGKVKIGMTFEKSANRNRGLTMAQTLVRSLIPAFVRNAYATQRLVVSLFFLENPIKG